MATGSRKEKYTGEDRVDEYLLKQVSEHVNHDKVGALSRTLGVPDFAYAAYFDSTWNPTLDVSQQVI